MTEQELEKNLAVLVNTYYMMQEGADMILKETERLLAEQGRVLHHKKKQKHNELMRKIAVIRNLIDTLSEDYGEAFKDNLVKKWDDLRMAGAFIARNNLTISDRCGNDETGRKENVIEEFIYFMPSNGYLSEEIRNKFFIK